LVCGKASAVVAQKRIVAVGSENFILVEEWAVYIVE
jgi:hypothetical protein